MKIQFNSPQKTVRTVPHLRKRTGFETLFFEKAINALEHSVLIEIKKVAILQPITEQHETVQVRRESFCYSFFRAVSRKQFASKSITNTRPSSKPHAK
jgi:hypothetical protein